MCAASASKSAAPESLSPIMPITAPPGAIAVSPSNCPAVSSRNSMVIVVSWWGLLKLVRNPEAGEQAPDGASGAVQGDRPTSVNYYVGHHSS